MGSRLLLLPTELCEMILGHLLSGEVVPSAQGPRRAYHTAIMRVNKKLYRESREYLYKNNAFVYVEYAWKEFGYAPHQHGIPLISESHGQVAVPRHLTLNMVLHAHGQHWAMCLDEVKGLTGVPGGETGSFLILLSDLTKLMSVISWQLDTMPVPRMYFDVPTFTFSNVILYESRPFEAKVELLANPFRQKTFLDLQRSSSFAKLLASFDGMRWTQTSETACTWTTLPIATTANYLAHKLWQNIAQALEMKTAADRLSRQGAIASARRLYNILVNHDILQFMPPDWSSHDFRRTYAFAYAEQLGIILCDAALNGAYLALHQLDWDNAQMLISIRWSFAGLLYRETDDADTQTFPDRPRWNHDLPMYLHMKALLMVGRCNKRRSALDNACNLLRSITPSDKTHAEYLRHDTEYIATLRDGPLAALGTIGAKDRIRGLSVCALPPRVFDSELPDPAMVEPPTAREAKLSLQHVNEMEVVRKRWDLPAVRFD